MIVLGITTSDECCGIAIRRDGATIASDSFSGSRVCVEQLIPRIDKLLTGGGLSLGDIDRFGMDAGPGGLTGIKIALATVKTLAQVVGKPVATVSSMRAMCIRAAREYKDTDMFLPIVSCTKVEIFTSIYRRTPEREVEIDEAERLNDEAGLRELLKGLETSQRILVLGSAAERMRCAVEEILGDRAAFAATEFNRPDAAIVCEAAETAGAGPYNEARPNYLCLTQAERNLGIKA